MGVLERIKAIEDEIARTQKNKATEYHIGLLKAKLSKLRSELMEGPKGKSGPGEGFDVTKSGDARVALVGFPSVGKSTMLSTLTKTRSEAASYEFTTLTCIPGVIEYKDAKIQLLDLPGIIEGAADGKGRGRQVISVARTADLIVMMLDASKAAIQKELLTKELESVGIRLNTRPPDVTLRVKKTGGASLNSMCGELTYLNIELVRHLLHEFKIHNADVLCREDVTVDEFIDVIHGGRSYIPCLYVCNKVDTISLDEVDRLAHKDHHVVVSFQDKLNLDYLLEKMWDYLNMVRVYTKPRGKRPDLTEPLIMKRGSTLSDICGSIHRDMIDKFKYGLVWGTSAKHQAQKCGIDHEVQDEDVVQIMTKGT